VGHPDLPFERAWLEPLLSERRDLEVIEAAAGIAGEDRDPHTWLVPDHASAMARRIAAGLRPLLPEHATELDENLRAFAALASELDGELGALFAAKRGAHFFVGHPAWGHLANRYGLVQRAIELEGKQPSAGDLAQSIASARALGVQVVVAQPQFDATAARAVATAIGARVEFADPLAPDWAEALRRSARVIAQAAVLPPAAAAGEG
jgi:zinc transport system substrate-binding protein